MASITPLGLPTWLGYLSPLSVFSCATSLRMRRDAPGHSGRCCTASRSKGEEGYEGGTSDQRDAQGCSVHIMIMLHTMNVTDHG